MITKSYRALIGLIWIIFVMGGQPAPAMANAAVPEDQSRRATAGQPDDPFWSHDFMLGVETIGNENDSYVFAMAVNNDKVYVGGDFTAAGGVSAQNIACWDSALSRWSALGSGIDGRVEAIAVYGSYVYVGGDFSHAGGVATGPLARWDANTQTWSAMGTILQDTISPGVFTIAVSGAGEVTIGGNFKSVDGILMNNIARRDSSGWHSLGSGITSGVNSNTRVNSIFVSSAITYAGGIFTMAGGYAANNIALWDGVSWHPIAGGVGGFNAVVNAIVYSGGDQIYVGGYFTQAYDGHGNTTPVNSIAVWDGAAWSNMSGGVNVDVSSLLYRGDGLYVAGRFTSAGGAPARRLARWTGASWVSVKDPAEINDGVDNNVYAITANSNYLFVGGSLEQAGDHSAHHIAAYQWTQKKWSGMGGSPNTTVRALAISSGYLYAGGSFTSVSNLPQAYLARWNMTSKTWYMAGNGAAITGCLGFNCTPVVNTIFIDGDDLYIGGNFTKIGSLTVNGIARFNGSDADYGWHALGSGVDCAPVPCVPVVRDIVRYNGAIYAGGSFTIIGGKTANNVAFWDGAAWNALDDFTTNHGTNGPVYVLNPMLTGLAVGGSFSTPCPDLARWNGSNWSGIGTAMNGPVYAMIGGAFGVPLTIGGGFTSPLRIAQLSGSAWQSLGVGLDDAVRALAFDGAGGLYAAGDFNYSSLLTLSHVAHWQYGEWFPLGSGANGSVYALAMNGKRLMIAGAFTSAGGYPSFYLGSWSKLNVFVPMIRV